LKRAGGRLDILVNNAGGTKRGHFLALTEDDWRDGYGVKFLAHVRLARAAWPLLKESGGSLVTIAGISGKEPEAEFTIGSSVNAACIAFTKALADLGKTDGVQVNTVSPGRVETERLWRRVRERVQATGQSEAKVRGDLQQQFGITRFGRTVDIASLIAFIASPHGRWLHGATIDMDGGEVRAI
jgi:3-oxoacyl-[acyl-carrier protein] reductase